MVRVLCLICPCRQNWTQKALQYCARWENPRKADEVQRNLDAVQAALREREKR